MKDTHTTEMTEKFTKNANLKEKVDNLYLEYKN